MTSSSPWVPSVPFSFMCSEFFVYAVHLFWETKLLNQTGIAALLSCLSCNILLYSSFLTRNLWNGTQLSGQMLYFQHTWKQTNESDMFYGSSVTHGWVYIFVAVIIFQYSVIANCDFQESKTSAALLISDIVWKSPSLVAVAVFTN